MGDLNIEKWHKTKDFLVWGAKFLHPIMTIQKKTLLVKFHLMIQFYCHSTGHIKYNLFYIIMC